MALVGEKRGVGVVIYKDLRGFIKQVDELGALRRVNGADPRFELGGITEVAAGTGECPALLFDRLKGFRPGFRVFTNATTNAAARGAGARHRPLAHPARRAEGLDGQAPDARAAKAGRGRRRAVPGKLHARPAGRLAQIAGALLAPQGRRAVHRLRLDRDHARSGRRLDQRLDLSRAGAGPQPRDDPVRSPRPPWRGDRPEILEPPQALPGRGGQRPGPGAVRRRLRIPAGRPVGVRLRRRDQGCADRGDRRPAHRPAAAGAGRDHPRRRTVADQQAHAAGRPVRRVHRLLRRRRPALPGDAGRRRPPPRPADPARLAADEAAALSFRPAVPRGVDLEPSWRWPASATWSASGSTSPSS